MSQHFSRQARLAAAFLAIYILWGSTYLAVALGLESIPPFLLMGLRSLAGGLVLLAWSGRQAGVLSGQAWLHAGACGLLFFVGCHGVLAYAQVRVPSGIAAIMLATIPFWITPINFVFPTARRPSTKTLIALLPGFAGVAFIAWRQATSHEHPVGTVEILLLLISALSWAIGSLLSRRHAASTSAIALSGMQLTVGGGALLIEYRHWRASKIFAQGGLRGISGRARISYHRRHHRRLRSVRLVAGQYLNFPGCYLHVCESGDRGRSGMDRSTGAPDRGNAIRCFACRGLSHRGLVVRT